MPPALGGTAVQEAARPAGAHVCSWGVWRNPFTVRNIPALVFLFILLITAADAGDVELPPMPIYCRVPSKQST